MAIIIYKIRTDTIQTKKFIKYYIQTTSGRFGKTQNTGTPDVLCLQKNGHALQNMTSKFLSYRDDYRKCLQRLKFEKDYLLLNLGPGVIYTSENPSSI